LRFPERFRRGDYFSGMANRKATMPESDDAAAGKARIQRQLIQALEKANIPERNNTNWLPKFFGGATSYWQMRDGDIEIVIRSHQFTGGRIDCWTHSPYSSQVVNVPSVANRFLFETNTWD
jgi:hypothetical protein